MKKRYTRYSGWNEEDAPEGAVRRFDTVKMQWVELPLDELPDEEIERHRGRTDHRGAEEETPGEITDVQLDLEKSGGSYRVDQFDVTVTNQGTEPLTVDRILLTFDQNEKAVPPKVVSIEPDQTKTIEIPWDWSYPDQETVTVDLRTGTETIATREIPLQRHR